MEVAKAETQKSGASIVTGRELKLALVPRFQRQAASYRSEFVSSPNSLLSKPRFEDSPYRWYKCRATGQEDHIDVLGQNA